MNKPIKGAEILLKSLSNHGINTIFGYPGSCVMSILDYLYNKESPINHVLVRHERGAIYAAQGYAQISKKVGVALVTSGPGATNTVAGITDAMTNNIPLIVITGQVNSQLLGTDAFQEVDIINITHSITKWVYQVRSASEISSAISHAFYIASSGQPGPVLLDITKDAQIQEAIYIPQKINSIRSYNSSKLYETEIVISDAKTGIKENPTDRIINILQDIEEQLIVILDIEHNSGSILKHNKFIRSVKSCSNGFGLPVAIGAKYAEPDKTVSLIVGSNQLQQSIQELGVVMQSNVDIKIVLLNSKNNTLNPNFVQVAEAYNIKSKKASKNITVKENIEKMLKSKGAYILEMDLEVTYSRRPNILA